VVDDRDAKPYQSSLPRIRRQRKEPRYGPYKGGLNTTLHLAVDAHGLPVRVLVTAGTTADCTQAAPLIKGLDTQYLLADRGYDNNDIVNQVESQGAIPMVPPRKNNKRSATF